MEPDKALLPLAQPVSSGSSGVSAPFSVLSGTLAGQTGALAETMIQLMTPPAIQSQAGGALKAGDAAHAFDRFCAEASSSAQSINEALAESARRSAEQAVRLLQDLGSAKGPIDALGLQVAFAASQMHLFMEQSRALQCELIRLFLPGTFMSGSQPRKR